MKATRPIVIVAALGLMLSGAFVITTSLLAQEATPPDADAGERYTCPMHLEIDEEVPGSCPICNMNLVTRSSLSKPVSDGEFKSGETEYTCPMHPQVHEHKPGSCPICGMDLVKRDTEPAGAPTSMPSTDATSKPGKMDMKGDAEASKKPRKIKHWVAPMDPTFISDKPGKSPMGMDLVPVYEGGPGGTTVSIDPVVVQNMGVRIRAASKQTIVRNVRTIGTVEVAENEVSVVNLRYSGWIEHIYVDETGAKVKRGQPLFSIYSPELVAAQQEYIMAVKSQGADSMLARSARTRLEFWNMPRGQINRIRARGKALRAISVGAPRAGYVLDKNVVLGARVNAGMDAYRIGNLDKIWVDAEVYEFDAPWIKVGQKATMGLSFERGKTYEGTVAYVYPTLNRKTRTLTVRLEFNNPELLLKPGMFTTVQIEAQQKPNTLAVPTEAIIHSGTRDLVFVAIALGKYEMRELKTGLVGDGDVTEVLSGLVAGERVVISGQFLLDSESQLQEAVQKLLDARLHSKEKRVEPAADNGDGQPKGEAGDTYWTCGMHPQVVQDGPGSCPICGMNLIEKKR